MDMRDEPIGVLLMRIARMRRHLLEETMRELGVTPSQHYLLMQLSRTGRGALADGDGGDAACEPRERGAHHQEPRRGRLHSAQ